jgi:hypothetical protein
MPWRRYPEIADAEGAVELLSELGFLRQSCAPVPVPVPAAAAAAAVGGRGQKQAPELARALPGSRPTPAELPPPPAVRARSLPPCSPRRAPRLPACLSLCPSVLSVSCCLVLDPNEGRPRTAARASRTTATSTWRRICWS